MPELEPPPDAAAMVLPEDGKQLVERDALCGGRFEVTWATGPMAGQRTSAYCAEPLCKQTGYCTGPRFVPHSVQHDAQGNPRRLKPLEIVPVARQCARMAIGKDDPRSDAEIRRFAGMVLKRLAESVRGRW